MRVTLSLPERATAKELLNEIEFMTDVLSAIFSWGEDTVVDVAIDPETRAAKNPSWDRYTINVTNQAAPDLSAIPVENLLLKTSSESGSSIY